MKKILLFIVAGILMNYVHAQNAGNTHPKLSLLTKKYLYEIKKSSEHALPEGYIYRWINGSSYIGALIKVSQSAVATAAIENAGGLIGTKAGNIWTVQVPVERVNEFCVQPGIEYIELDQPVFPQLDVARHTTHVDSVQSGINLPMPYSGHGVILGDIDFGFDYNHPAFYDTLHSVYRIKRVWELNGTGTPPAGYAYGNEMTDTAVIKAHGTDNALQMHGTSTAGIAAGSGYGSTPAANRFRGMAYDADYVLVGVRRDTIAQQWLQGSFSDFIDGINYIFSYASSVGKPAVVNISWGSQSGPHDGTTLFNQACNNLSGPGKIIVMSAGNEGEEKIHLTKTFTPADTMLSTFLKFTPAIYRRTWVDIWGDPGKTFCAKVTLYHNGTAFTSTGFYCIDDSIHDVNLTGSNGTDTCSVQFITTASAFNGKPRVTIDFYNKSTDSALVTIMSNDGTVHAWNEYYFYGFDHGYQSSFDNFNQPWAVSGNVISTVSDMGSADSVILIGAYCSKTNFTDINGNAWTYNGYVQTGHLVPFSSRGPLVDGRIKPDITAPGLTVCTSVSSYDTSYTPTGSNSALVIKSWQDPVLNKPFYYAEFSGTSASAPCVSGIVALMLQAVPTLSPQQLKDIVIATAITDGFTGSLPAQGTNDWGHGKINAYQAMRMLLNLTGVYEHAGAKLDCVVFPNPGTGRYLLDLNAAAAGNLKLEAFDVKGDKVLLNDWHVLPGANQRYLDLSAFSDGEYFVKVSSSDGSVTMKVIKQQ